MSFSRKNPASGCTFSSKDVIHFSHLNLMSLLYISPLLHFQSLYVIRWTHLFIISYHSQSTFLPFSSIFILFIYFWITLFSYLFSYNFYILLYFYVCIFLLLFKTKCRLYIIIICNNKMLSKHYWPMFLLKLQFCMCISNYLFFFKQIQKNYIKIFIL